MSAEETKKGGKKKGGLLIGLFVVIIIAMAAVIVILLLGNKNQEESEKAEKRNVVVNQDNAEEVADELVSEARQFVEPGYYTVNMDMEWHFSKGDAVSENARVDNLSENTNDVYFDVFLADNEDEAIYKSPVIPVGGYLEDIALDKPLEMGTYDCVIVYHLVDDEQNSISTLRVAFQIVVES